MAEKKTKPGYDFIVSVLQSDPQAIYKDVAAAAVKKGHSVYPIMYGRAKAALGLVKSKPRGQGKAKVAAQKAAQKAIQQSGPEGTVGKRGPGRPRKNSGVAFDGTLGGIVAAVKNSEQTRARYRGALERIQSILAEALS